jgi:hypothetical protein
LFRTGGPQLTKVANYAALDVEELGSVYESLLDFHPTITFNQRRPVFGLATGTECRTTGSYCTRPGLVHELIKNVLEPVTRIACTPPGMIGASKSAL